MTDLIPLGDNLPERVHRAECIPVPFLDGFIPAVMINGKPSIIIKPIVDLLGIAWAPQYTKLSAARWACITLVVTQVPGDAQPRQWVALSMRGFVVWLAGIQEGRVREEAQETVIRYKEEAGDALEEHFFGKPDAFGLPKTFAEALELAARQQRMIEAAARKVAVYDAWFDPDNAVETTDFAKRLGLRSAQDLNKRMQQCRIVRKDVHPRTGKSRNLPTADWGHCFKVVPTRIATGSFVDVAWITPEGQLEIVEELRNNGLIDF